MYPKRLGKFFYSICIAFCLMAVMAGSAVSGQAEDAKKYMEMLESDSTRTRTDAAKYITRSGLTDPVLFETVKTKLLTGYTHNQLNAKHMDEMAWYCKALASSGNFAYEETLRKVARTTTSEKLKRHCRQSIDQIPVHAKRNKVIQEGMAGDKSLSSRENKMIAMFRSKDPALMRDAAKMTYRNPFSGKAVPDVISEELLNACPLTSGNRIMTDALSWMCKALGASGNPKYRATLTEVIEISTSEKLKKYARKSLAML